MRFENRVALVTGGSAGIGAGIVERILSEGGKVAFCGRDPQKLAEAQAKFQAISPHVLGLQCDVSDSAQVKAMFARVLETFGTLDILINNAGMPRRVPADRDRYLAMWTNPGPKASLGITRYMTDEEWDASIRTNLYAVFYCCREALNIMEDKGYGRIVNIASSAGVSNRSPHSPNYSAGKGGVVAFSRSLAAEVAPAGVVVNAVSPGSVGTKYMSSFAAKNQDTAARMVMGIALNRMSTVEEQVAVITFLASEECSYVIGQNINVNGGMF